MILHKQLQPRMPIQKFQKLFLRNFKYNTLRNRLNISRKRCLINHRFNFPHKNSNKQLLIRFMLLLAIKEIKLA